ncbi:MAG: 16S rRNA (guanine(966)-N(2))-methyltransferase RsmD [Thermoguttaceae bacterium]|nr:16S rRNA (guanine(966)-N(2))-methyltransferase RsmD [Thermoguttaceae bacterium]MDW8078328.1 16S rRNA (guanine(966)-N(2))-methyltransferase RsmD [Thermoguttaceae bacterium]
MKRASKGQQRKSLVPGAIPPRHKAVHGLRIIGGKFKGRRIAYNGFVTVRPMRDIVREALFAHLAERVEGKHVYDLFAGTGALGLEALSRGAARVTFVERHYPTLETLRQNVASLGVENQCEIVFGDCFVWGRRLQAPVDDTPWLVFVCPPYAYFHSQPLAMRELLARLLELAPTGSIVVAEADNHFRGEALPENFTWHKRDYGQTVLWIATKE